MTREILISNELDYISRRMLFLGINNWQRSFYNAYISPKPVGLIQHQDPESENSIESALRNVQVTNGSGTATKLSGQQSNPVFRHTSV